LVHHLIKDPHLQIQSHSGALGVSTSTHELEGDKIQPITMFLLPELGFGLHEAQDHSSDTVRAKENPKSDEESWPLSYMSFTLGNLTKIDRWKS
jgi:hypothetical protein